MAKKFHPQDAEREANEIAFRFQDSSDVMADMGRAYHVDFSNINIHTDSAADSKVKAAGKDALAKGNDIFFGKGILESGDPAGKGLLAHELAHTMQQGAAGGGEAAVSEMAPMGAEQGGMLDWFKGLFKKKPKTNAMGIIEGSGKKMTDEASMNYMNAMRAREAELSRGNALAGALHQNTGEGLSAETLQGIAALGPQAIAKSNSDLAASIARGDEEAMQISNAYQGFGHRSTSSEIGRFDRDVRADQVLNGSINSYQNYIRTRVGNGENFEGLLSGSTQYQGGVGVQTINQGIAGGAGDLLSIIGSYLTDDKGLDYIQSMIDQVKDADIFKGGAADPMNYVMTTILTGEGLRGVGSMKQTIAEMGLGDKRASQAGDFAAKSMKNLMALPVMERQTQAQRDALPPDVKPLFEQYMRLQQEIRDKLAARAAG